ncbi:hypothetical protein CHARACLAT_015145 [Characodon lateralis]|uniref:Uncharacterized protein n=1 Tax=Characodon lateralis TaxID=208331 RepID=A0ABU7EB65_9TELE|nr:hypothetical protein [Characodon lateralis]
MSNFNKRKEDIGFKFGLYALKTWGIQSNQNLEFFSMFRGRGWTYLPKNSNSYNFLSKRLDETRLGMIDPLWVHNDAMLPFADIIKALPSENRKSLFSLGKVPSLTLLTQSTSYCVRRQITSWSNVIWNTETVLQRVWPWWHSEVTHHAVAVRLALIFTYIS